MKNILIPKTYIENIEFPLIFLAGPIRSAPQWHNEAIKIIHSQNQNIYIASPKKKVKEKFQEKILEGNENYFPRQRAWERHYLEIASKKGFILFWLPGEESHNCKKVYGAMTRIELGQWMTNYKNDNSIKICIGSDDDFPELDTIKYDLSLDIPNIKILNNLEETCQEALKVIS